MICCVTGHRPKGFPFMREGGTPAYENYCVRLYREIRGLILQGCNHFITGMADGADIDFAKQVICLRDQEQFEIVLEAALPYSVNLEKCNDEKYDVLMKCDQRKIVSPRYFEGCMQKRNRYMVDKADIVLAIWNGEYKGGTWNTIRYARERGVSVRYISLEEIARFPFAFPIFEQ